MLLLDLALMCTLLQQPAPAPTITLPPDHRVALVFDSGTQFARLDESQRLYETLERKRLAGTWTEDDVRLHAALTVALGTLHDERLIAPALSNRSRWEIQRGVRKPLQGKEN